VRLVCIMVKATGSWVVEELGNELWRRPLRAWLKPLCFVVVVAASWLLFLNGY
jgi:hypothetical protein